MPTVRAAEPAEAAALTALARAAYARYVPLIGAEPAPMTENYAARIAAGQVWVADRDTTVAGLLVLQPHPDHLLLDNVAVHPAAQGTGVGALLLDFAVGYAREQGFTELRLYTNEAMTGNLAWYPRRGFTETHRAVEHGLRRVYFARHLEPGRGKTG